MMKTIVLSRFLVTVFLLISFNRVYADPLTLATFDMEKYLNIDEPSIIANYSQGEQLYNQGQYQEAIDHFANNIAWGESIQFLGDNYYKASSTGYPTIAGENADGFFAYYNSMYKLGYCYFILGEYEQAISYYKIMTGRFVLFDYGF